MSFDPKKTAERITLNVRTARNSGYTGIDVLRIAEALQKNPQISEKALSSTLHLDPGYRYSGVGDLKRLVLSIMAVARNSQ